MQTPYLFQSLEDITERNTAILIIFFLVESRIVLREQTELLKNLGIIALLRLSHQFQSLDTE